MAGLVTALARGGPGQRSPIHTRLIQIAKRGTTMKMSILCLLTMGSVLGVAPVFAHASRVLGTVTFVRTFASERVRVDGGRDVTVARFEIRVKGTCDGVPLGNDGISIRVRSGRLDDDFAENVKSESCR